MPHPHAVVVGTDATALHVGGQLLARGFEVTLLEATEVVGGQWVRRLTAEKQERNFNAWDDGVFLDYPLLAPRLQRSSCSGLDNDVATEAVGNAKSTAGAGPSPQQKPPPPPPPSEEELRSHLAGYAQAAGLCDSVRLGCTLRRAKWQAMNGCWRLEVKYELAASRQAQRGNLSADLLVVSRMAVAAPRLPHVQGRELYCGTVLTANDQLSGASGAAMLDQQLHGRHVVVVGAVGCGTAAGWADACRRHAGSSGSVVLLEVDDTDASTAAAAAERGRRQGGGLLGGLFGGCFGLDGGMHGGGGSGSGSSSLERYSPALPAVAAEVVDAAAVDGELEGGDLLTAAGGSTASTTAEGEAEGVVLGQGQKMSRMRADSAGEAEVLRASCGIGGGEGVKGSGGEEYGGGRTSATRDHGRRSRPGQQHLGGSSDGRGKLPSGRSSLRVIRGTGALLNGTHITFPSGEELPADVVLLVPLAGLEPSLAFLDAGPNWRTSQTGGAAPSMDGTGNNVSGSYRRTATGGNLAAPSVAMSTAAVDGAALSRAVEELYRDMVPTSPVAPNLALVGAGAHASQHDARTAAAQAAWLLATWAHVGGDGAAALAAAAAAGGGAGAAAGGSMSTRRRRGSNAGAGGWDGGGGGVPEAGFLRQATPVEAAADAALRARWRAQAAARGRPELYLQRYLGRLLEDLGAPCGDKQTWPRWLCGRPAPAPAQLLSRQRVARLLGVKRLRRLLPPAPSPQQQQPPPLQWSLSADGSVNRSHHHRALQPQLSYNPSSHSYHHQGSGALYQGSPSAHNLLSAGAGPGPSPSGFSASRAPSRTASHATLSNNRLPSVATAMGPASTGGGAVAGRSGQAGNAAGSMDPAAREQRPQQQQRLQHQHSQGSRGLMDMALRSESAFSCSGAVGQPSQQSPVGFFTGHPGHQASQGLRGGAMPASHSFSRSSSHSAALSFQLQEFSNQQQHLYRVAEHPTEHLLGDAVAAAHAAAPGGEEREPQLCQQQQPLQQYSTGQLMASCPSSPQGPISTAAGASAGQLCSGSVGAGTSLPTSPFTSSAMAGAGAGALATAPAGGAGSPASAAAADEAAAARQRWRSQMLTRQRSTSRLAGVSGPLTPQSSTTAAASAASFLGLSAARRPPAASTSQVNLDIGGSFSNDRRSQGGRSSYTKRNTGPVSGAVAGAAAGGGSGGGSPILGRVNSAARLQLLMAAANSASRRRNTAFIASQSPSAVPSSPEPYRTSASGGVVQRRASGHAVPALHRAYIEALPAGSATGATGVAAAMGYGARQTRSQTSSVGGSGGNDGGMRPGGMGTSMSGLLRSGGDGGGEQAVEQELKPASAPSSPGIIYRQGGESVDHAAREEVRQRVPCDRLQADGEAAAAPALKAAETSYRGGAEFDGEDELHKIEEDAYLQGGGDDEEGSGPYHVTPAEAAAAAAGRKQQPRSARSHGAYGTRRRSVTLPDLRVGGCGARLGAEGGDGVAGADGDLEE